MSPAVRCYHQGNEKKMSQSVQIRTAEMRKTVSSSSRSPRHARSGCSLKMPASLEEEKRNAAAAAAVWSTDAQGDAQTPLPSAARLQQHRLSSSSASSLLKAQTTLSDKRQLSAPITGRMGGTRVRRQPIEKAGQEQEWREEELV